MQRELILIVDDEPLNLDALRQVLNVDYRLTFARNGHEALVAADKHKPSLVLMDIQMPEMDGYSACLALRDKPSTANIPVIFVTSLNDVWDETLGLDCGAVDYITKPISPSVVRARVKTHLSLVQASKLKQSYHDAVYMLGKAGHYNDNDTGVHIWRMAAYARELAFAAGWPVEDCRNLELAAPMHDTGKIGIPGAILRKPGKLDAAEWEVMRTHTQIGHDILRLSDSPMFSLAAEVALRHHEKWDGSGYPDGLAGNAIPESARIVAIADVFDALTMRRPYKEPWPIDRVVGAIREGVGSHFDPRLAEAFLSILPKILEIKAEWDEIEVKHDGNFLSKISQESASPSHLLVQDALRAHREWKLRFVAAIARREPINAATVGADDACAFGQWLRAQGLTALGQAPAYAACLAAHTEFHRAAYQVAQCVNAGDFAAATEMISAASPYQRASEAIASSVNAMLVALNSQPVKLAA